VHVIAEDDESEPLSRAMLNAEAHYYEYKGCVDNSGATFRKYVCSTEVKPFNYQLPTYDGIPADPATRIGMSDQELEELTKKMIIKAKSQHSQNIFAVIK